jgi:hypothetical protein
MSTKGSGWTPQRVPWDEKRVDELKKAIANVDRPRSSRPLKKSECKQHAFIESDRCHWCGAPMEEKK